ncbi:NAD dependent epimerase/dehydratase [Paenibacillus sp. J31TS4]|uniref:NAD-dependent epimerase/dehydratase family protein n=1 Tax=Paenibacillus sp. J31TS4 TaxID=2807195 RepID=UPI001B012840|nr:NAD-dependent epimerase/dehydratase family protein [Paenibacillus sp. J31TS4]GIP39368.1 NAD dependent epimerase/dehydratase [Paenibacillus sp. J31TS4]
MSSILVLGGTRFFGKKLVERLVHEGHDVTVATRGQTPDPFGDRVRRLTVDRENRESLLAAAAAGSWDVVYDNIGYTARAALDACEAFAGRTSRYIFTSTLAVYEINGEPHAETDFDPYSYPIQPDLAADYGEGKRQAEAVLFQKASFPVCAVRFPVVLGTDDYTKRLLFHVERVRSGQPIGFPNGEAAMSFITSDEAARFLAWLGAQEAEGPFNATSTGTLTLRQIIHIVEDAVGREARIQNEPDADNRSPFALPASWTMTTDKAAQAGYTFPPLDSWFRPLVEELAAAGK